MRGSIYQPTDCTGGGKLINQEVAWVSISFDVAYCEPSSARILVKLDGTTVLDERITPGTSPTFEKFISQRYVSSINFVLSVTDWTVAINKVITEWADAAQAPTPPPNGPPPICTPYESKCDGYNLYQCQFVDGIPAWVFIESNSLWCGYVPPNGPPDGDGDGSTFDRILAWIKAHPVESVVIGVGTYLLVRGK